MIAIIQRRTAYRETLGSAIASTLESPEALHSQRRDEANREGNQMKTTLAMLALCAFAPNALAAAPECRAVENTIERLSCYDAAYPPKIEKQVVFEKDPPRVAYKDPLYRGRRQNQRQAKEYLPRLLRDGGIQFRHRRVSQVC
jgi:hypothetical protein